jgi:hypothetical protein
LTWIKELKVAVINSDMDAMLQCIDRLPDFSTLNAREAQEVQGIIALAVERIENEQKKLKDEMEKVTRVKEYLNRS